MLNLKETPSYIRLLGMTDIGQKYLNQHKKSLPLPLISKLSSFRGNGDLDIEFDLKASQLYALGLTEPYKTKLLNLEIKQPPIILNN
jgi:hypothetical protein